MFGTTPPSFRPANDVNIPAEDLVSWTFSKCGEYDQDRPIYVDVGNESRSISARQARHLVMRLVAGFQAHGLEQGDCVCIHMFNDILYPILWLGAIAAGGCVAGSNPSSSVLELHHHLKVSQAKFIITQKECLPTVTLVAKQRSFSPSRIFVLPSPGQCIPDGYTPMEALLSFGEVNWRIFEDGAAAVKTVASLNSTSGTTGLPKAAALTHTNLLAQMAMIYHDEKSKPYQVSQLICLPMFHAFAGMLALMAPLRLGYTTYVMRRFELQPFLTAVQKFSITETAIVPPIVISLVKCGASVCEYLHPLRYVRCAGTQLHRAVQGGFCELLSSRCVVAQIWGMTECGWITGFHWSEKDDTGSVGRQFPSVEIKVVNASGRTVDSEGQDGEARIRSPAVFQGYLDNPSANASAFDPDGFFRTGDLASYIGGKWFLSGRIKDTLKVHGFQVSPAEIESILLRHPQVADCCVVGIKYDASASSDEVMLRAYVKLKNKVEIGERASEMYKDGTDEYTTQIDRMDGNTTCRDIADSVNEQRLNDLVDQGEHADPNKSATEQDIVEYLARRVIRYKRLTGGVQFLDELPRSPAGKLIKRLLPIPEGAGFSIYQ